MDKFVIFIIFMVFKVANSADYNEMLNVLKIFFVRRHVQTVTAAITCWPFDVNKKLLDDLSTADISVSFNSHTLQYYSTWYRCAFIIDLSCENSTEILQQISNDRLFNTQNDWILFDQNSFANETNSAQFALRTFQLYLGNAYVLPDASVFLFLKTYDGVWEIWSGFRASKSDAIRVFEIGTASLNRMTIREMHDEKRNFRGVTLKSTSVIVEKDSFFGFDKKISSDLDVFAHMHYEMIVTLTNQLNFKTEITIVNDYGWYLGNGSFGGLIGLLQNEAIDFSATGVLIRTDRMSVIDFAVGIVELRTAAMFRQPSLSSVHNILLLPFTTDVWIGVCATFCVFVFTLMFLMRVNNYLGEKKYGSLNVPEIVTLVHGAICQQGFNSTLTLISIRVVIAVLFFTSVFFYTSYSASIAALVQSNSNSIKSIKDIVESSMTFSTQISPYGKRYFEETEDSDLKKLYKTKMVPYGNKAFVKTAEGMERIRTEFHGFMVEIMSAYQTISKEWREEEKCALGEIQLFKLPLLSIALVKKSGHKDIFKQKLIQQMEIGLSKRISNQWIPPKPSCGSSSRTKQYVSVSVKETFLTLAVFGFGICISLVIFILEILHFTWTKHRSKKNR
ncbi:glutamate receptor ionotropic, kainate glr-3-like [Aphis gossypii]|uniref:glutamate receptor ionotropic, kainate glr-3-like n=1 Tax=Aphis gossypii TaxID=80765 RepID=UPI002158B62F|nr:glutamate receptor ionotropic, kainate glr-3-like [Aphis gossypii]